MALLLVEVAFSDEASTTPDETVDVTSQEDDAKEWNSDAKPALSKFKVPRFACRPMRTAQVKAILNNKARALRSLGVRLVRVPRSLRNRLRRFKKITLPRRARHRSRRPSFEMCRERPARVKLTSANYANADLAYRTQGVECAESFCNIRIGGGISLSVNGRCALRSTTIVLPVYNGCSFVDKTIDIGCSCKCRARSLIG